jgi:hypothetical protein
MSQSVNVNELASPYDLTRSHANDRKIVARRAAICLLIAVGLVSYVAGIFYLKSILIPADLPALGQFFGT